MLWQAAEVKEGEHVARGNFLCLARHKLTDQTQGLTARIRVPLPLPRVAHCDQQISFPELVGSVGRVQLLSPRSRVVHLAKISYADQMDVPRQFGLMLH